MTRSGSAAAAARPGFGGILEQAPDLRRDDVEAGRQREDRRRAEHGQRLQDGDQRPGQHRRQHERQGDPPQRRREPAAEHGGGVLEVGRHALERVDDQGEDVGEGVAGDGEDEALEGVDVDEVLVGLEPEQAALGRR